MASGRHYFAGRDAARSSRAPGAFTASASTSVTIAIRPSQRRRDAVFVPVSWGKRKEEYFLCEDWKGCVALKLQEKFVFLSAVSPEMFD